MARGRLISRTLGSSRKFAALHQAAGELAEFAQTLYPLMVACSDDFGRLSGDAFSVRCAVFPSSPRREEEFAAVLLAMESVGLLILFDAGGQQVAQIAEFESHQPGLSKRTGSKFPAPPGKSREPREIPKQEKRREEKGTEENRREESTADAVPASDPCLAFGDAWNDVTSSPLPACQAMTPKRRRHIAARLAERSLDEWRAVFGKIQASAFCCGKNDRTWVATFDWVIGSADVAVKVLEGKYDDRGKPRSRAAGPVYSHWQEECQALHGGTCTKHWEHGTRMQQERAS
jgi:hypothetical protein